MADKRKLQGEIDRCLKRVQEGVDTFEDTWQKVHNSANANQKEKYEGDLKKEIKKLQRQRDQIKTWLASSDIKDKRTLTEARKLIETQMERFKVVERETKTKAYSKEGLGAAAKLDPAAKEKAEVTGWISQLIENLKIQLDQFESEVELLSAGNKKKKMDKERHDRYEELKGIQDKHNFHIGKLETIMRMVDNDALPLDQIRQIREDVEYYVDFNQDPDFEENEFLYDELELDDIDGVLTASSPPNEDGFSDKLSTTPTSTDSSSPSPSPGFTVNHSKDKNEDSDRNRHKSQEESKNKNNQAILSTSSSSSTISSTNKVPNTPTKQFPSSPSSVSSIENSNHLPNTTPPPHVWYDSGQNSNSEPAFNSSTASWQHNWNSTPTPGGPAEQSANESKSQSNSFNHVSSSLLVNSLSTSSNNTSVVNSVSTNSIGNPSIPPAPLINNLITNNCVTESNTSSAASATNNSSVITSLSVSSAPSQVIAVNSNGDSSKVDGSLTVVMNGPTNTVGSFHQGSLSESMSSLKSIAQQAVVNAGLENQIPPSSHSPSSNTKVPFNSSGSQNSPQTTSTPSQDPQLLQQQQQQQPQTTTIHLNRLLGVAPLGPVPLGKEHFYQLTMEEAGFHHLPHPSDSERLRPYLPRNPCTTPPYYPQLPPPHADSVEFFQRLSTETLFFIFYYMEGTKAQYLAAKALKKQSWRFHTKYMMWFQRHEEPKTINEDYEQGTYIYFDYEKWGQRKKEGFTFQYQFLEDRDLN